MAGKQANILSLQAVEELLLFAETTRQPDRNRVIVLLSFKAGLRAAEIASLTWEMVETAEQQIGQTIELRNCIAKNGRGRRIPLQADLHEARPAAQNIDGTWLGLLAAIS